MSTTGPGHNKINNDDGDQNSADTSLKRHREVESAVLSGTVIGRTLQDALNSLRKEDDDEENQNQATTHGRGTKDDQAKYVRMDDGSVEKILESFGQAVVKTEKNNFAPRALLRGRCDYYNKFGPNLIVSMDQVRIKPRPIKFKKLNRSDKQSLWDRDDDDIDNSKNNYHGDVGVDVDRTKNTNENEIAVKEKILLLSYGDDC